MHVSIIITSYNYSEHIERCINSCLAQEMPENSFEIIVVDDCSVDGTHELLTAYESIKNFRYHVTSENIGVAGAANIGIQMARGQFVVRVDADDYVSPAFAHKLSQYLVEKDNELCVSCDYQYVDDQGEIIERRSAKEYPISCGIMYRKNLLMEYGLYNSEWRHREEEELRRRLGERYKIQHLRELLYNYVMHDNNKTKQVHQMEEFRKRLSLVNRCACSS